MIGNGVSSQLKATLLRMFRELYAQTAKTGIPLSKFGVTETFAEAGLLDLLDSLSRDQIEAVLRAVFALGEDMLKNSKMPSPDTKKWIKQWMAKNTKGVKVTDEMSILAMGIFMASAATVQNEKALLEIMSPDDYAKFKLEAARMEGKFDA